MRDSWHSQALGWQTRVLFSMEESWLLGAAVKLKHCGTICCSEPPCQGTQDRNPACLCTVVTHYDKTRFLRGFCCTCLLCQITRGKPLLTFDFRKRDKSGFNFAYEMMEKQNCSRHACSALRHCNKTAQKRLHICPLTSASPVHDILLTKGNDNPGYYSTIFDTSHRVSCALKFSKAPGVSHSCFLG